MSADPLKRYCFQPLPRFQRIPNSGLRAASLPSEARKEKLLEGDPMRKLLIILTCILFVVAPLFADVASAADQTKDDDLLRNCGMVLKEILDVPDNIPQDLLDKADCVVVFPSVVKA